MHTIQCIALCCVLKKLNGNVFEHNGPVVRLREHCFVTLNWVFVFILKIFFCQLKQNICYDTMTC